MLNKVSIKVAFSLLLIWYLWIVFHSINSKSSQAIWRHHAICLSWDRIGTMPSNIEQSINHLRYFRMKLFKEYCWLRTNSRRKCLKSNALFTVRSCRYDVRQVNINMLTLCFFALRLLFRQPVGVGELGTSSTAVGRYVTELLGTVSSSFSIITSCAPTAPQIRFFLYRNKT